MARIRSIKPSFFLNDQLAELPALARILFVGLWTVADRRGRLEDRPKRLKAELLPYDDCDVNDLLQGLHNAGFIIRYRANGTALIQVVTFEQHQRITGSEADTESEYPEPTEETTPNHSGNTEETPRTTGKEGKGKEGKGENDAHALARVGAFDPLSVELPPSVPPDAWALWVTHRREKHKPLTRLAAKEQLVFLDVQPDPKACLMQSIRNGWAGLFPLKADDAPKPTNGKTMTSVRDTVRSALGVPLEEALER